MVGNSHLQRENTMTIYQGLIREDKTDLDMFYKLASETLTTQMFFTNKGHMPEYGDIILVVSADRKRKGIQFIAKVVSLTPQLFTSDMNGYAESDIGSRTARTPNRGKYYVIIKAVSSNALQIPESWVRGDLKGCRQSTFKVIPETLLSDDIRRMIVNANDELKHTD